MRHHKKNGKIALAVDSFGAEMKSLVREGREYLWQGSSDSWGSTSPQLFPIVGELLEPGWLWKGKRLKMGNHGIARRNEFALVDQGEDFITLELEDDDVSKEAYPFSFRLKITYKIEGSSLLVSYSVANPSEDEELLFSLGAHPGFNCPLDGDGHFDDYYLLFNKKETSERLLKDHYLTGVTEASLKNQDRIDLSHDLFDRGALIYEGLISDRIELKNDKSPRSIVMEFSGYPYFGIWTIPGKKAPFICLEPWHGIDSTEGDSLEFADKKGLIRLKPGEDFNCYYRLTLN